VVVKTRAHGWVVIFGSGYNNADGRGYFFVVNPRTGQLIAKVGTGVGSPTGQAGLAQLNAFVVDRTDGVADAVYAGDLLGNLWRLDVSGDGSTFPAPQLIARLERGGQPLPVTTQPLITVEPQTLRRWIAVGTGRLLHVSDIANSTGQRFYAIQDGNNRRFARASDLPPGISFPIGVDQLQELTDPTVGLTLLPTRLGWYLELGTNAGSPSWRVVRPASGFYGTIAFASTLPSTSDACAPTGSSRVYAIDLRSGRSRLTTATTPAVPVAYVTAPPGSVTDIGWRSISQAGAGRGTLRLMVSTDGGQATSPPTSGMGPASLRRLNWREVAAGN
jgi:type IV pilus assembly protein PilY1